MQKLLKIIAGGLGLVALFMMFLPQVVIHWNSGIKEAIGIQAFAGGTFGEGTEIKTIGAGLAGYILLGAAGLILLLCAFVPFFKDHDVLNYIATGLAIICLIVGIIMIFLIRKNFMDTNGFMSKEVYVGAGAIVGGSLGGLAIAFGGLGLILDFAK